MQRADADWYARRHVTILFDLSNADCVPNVVRSMAAKEKSDSDLSLDEQRTELAARRTRDALERTLMSWIRTALAMVSYGFGLFKVLQYMAKAERGEQLSHSGSDIVTALLIGMGTGLLIVAMVQYWVAMRELRKEQGLEARFPLPLVGATGVALVGVFALMNVLFLKI